MTDVDTAKTFPFDLPRPAEPAPEYARLREREPVAEVRLPTGDAGWVVTGYQDVRAMCVDARLSKEAVTEPGAPRLLPIARGSKSMVNLDPPEHTRLRALVSKAFTPRRIELLRPRIAELAESFVDDMLRAARTSDALVALALPLPITVICELLGVPVGDQQRFRQWSDQLLAVREPGQGAEEIQQAGRNLAGYLDELIEAKRADPGEDLITGLLAAHDTDDALDTEELRAFAMTLLIAGYHTTTAAIGHAIFHLLRADGTAYAQLRDDPGLLDTAVEELLRYSQVATGFGAMRIAIAEVELGGTTLAPGAPVIPIFGSANRDSSVFTNPDELDLAREHNPHLAFGAGIHYCLGAQLARTELAVLLSTLTARVPTLALAVPEDDVEWEVHTAFPRPSAVPVRW